MDVMPTLGKVDAVVTDPPYGVDFSGKVWHSTNRGKTVKRNGGYSQMVDSADEFEATVIPAIERANELSSCGLVFMADRSFWKLPEGKSIGGIFSPASTGLSSWGFTSFMLCAFYGKDPYLANGLGSRPTGKYGLYANDANKVAHPCAKPLQAMLWAVERASLESQSILDPFMGSGTTGVACVQLQRRFIGIEIDETYFDIACKRIEEAYKQPSLFPAEKPKPVKNLDLF